MAGRQDRDEPHDQGQPPSRMTISGLLVAGSSAIVYASAIKFGDSSQSRFVIDQ